MRYQVGLGWRSTSLIFAEPFGDLSLVCRVVLVHSAGGVGSLGGWCWFTRRVVLVHAAGGVGSLGGWCWFTRRVVLVHAAGGVGSLGGWCWFTRRVVLVHAAGGGFWGTHSQRVRLSLPLLKFRIFYRWHLLCALLCAAST